MHAALAMAIGLLASVAGTTASFAQEPVQASRGEHAGPRLETGTGPPHGGAAGAPPSQRGMGAGVAIEMPMGTVSVGPEYVEGDPVYIRRTAPAARVAMVEISTAPFAAELVPVTAALNGRPDQPASW